MKKFSCSNEAELSIKITECVACHTQKKKKKKSLIKSNQYYEQTSLLEKYILQVRNLFGIYFSLRTIIYQEIQNMSQDPTPQSLIHHSFLSLPVNSSHLFLPLSAGAIHPETKCKSKCSFSYGIKKWLPHNSWKCSMCRLFGKKVQH